MQYNNVLPEDNHTSSSLPKAMETKASSRVMPRACSCHNKGKQVKFSSNVLDTIPEESESVWTLVQPRIMKRRKRMRMQSPPPPIREIDWDVETEEMYHCMKRSKSLGCIKPLAWGCEDDVVDVEQRELYRKKKRSNRKAKQRKAQQSWETAAQALHKRQTNLSPDEVKQLIDELSLDVEPHGSKVFGLDIDTLKTLAKLSGYDVSANRVLSTFENMALLLTGLSSAPTESQALVYLALFFKAEYHGSFGIAAYDYVSKMFGVVPQSDGKPVWISELRRVLTDWRQLLCCPLREHIQKLVSILVTLGLCTHADMSWSVGNLLIFQPEVHDKQVNAFDFTDAILSTFMFFVESGWACFEHGSVTPLFFGDGETLGYAKEFAFLVSTVQHVKSGNLQKHAGVTEQEYEMRLDTCIHKTEELLRRCSSKIEIKTISDRLSTLNNVKNTFNSTRMGGGFRKAPFVTLFWGNSGVGKTALTTIDMEMTLNVLGVPHGPENIATLNEFDKYDSSVKGYTTGIQYDDIGNIKEQFLDGSPAATLNRFNNNTKTYAIKADVDEKYKVDVNVYAMNATSNMEHGGIGAHSKEPASVGRRFHLQVEVKVKPEFQKTYTTGIGCLKEVHREPSLDQQKVMDYYLKEKGLSEVPPITDVWELTVRKAVVGFSGYNERSGLASRIAEDEEGPLENVDIYRYLRFKAQEVQTYMGNQERLVDTMNNLHDRMKYCGVCRLPDGVCRCKKEVEPHFGFELGYKVLGPMVSAGVNDWFAGSRDLECMAASELLKYGRELESSMWFGLGMLLPENFYRGRVGQWFTNMFLGRITDKTVRRMRYATALLAIAPLTFPRAWRCKYAWGSTFGLLLCRNTIAYHFVHKRVCDVFQRERDALPAIYVNARERYMPRALAAGGVIFAAYAVVRIWQGMRAAQRDSHGMLQPETKEDVDIRDAEQNPWKKSNFDKVELSTVQASSSFEKVVAASTKNLKTLLAPAGGNSIKRVCMFMLASNVGVIPHHYWEGQDSINATVIGNNGHTIATVLYRKYSVDIPDTDFTLVYCPALGSQADFTKFLPEEEARCGQARGVFRDREGSLHYFDAHAKREWTGHLLKQFMGGSAVYTIPTEKGMCMSPLFCKDGGTQIIGFHLGGKSGEAFAVYGTLTQKQVRVAMSQLSELEGVIASHSDVVVRTKVFGQECLLSDEPHEKSPVFYLEPGEANVRVYGECTGRATFRSQVCQLPMSSEVEKVFGVSNKWGAPHTSPAWKPWYECLKYAAHPTQSMPADLLIKSIEDYQRPLLGVVCRDYIKADVRPLTKMESVCGIEGKRFIDRMNMSSSVGYPVGGPKSRILIELDPEEYEGFSAPADFPQQIWDEVAMLEDSYRKGERAKAIFKACLKDEPTPVDKEKVRVFQCAPISIQLLLRKYYLPVVRVLSIFPLISECAVGVNCVGPEWDQLQKHMEKFGTHRILAGDYSKYDLRLPAQMTLAAFRILVNLARATGNYSEEDILIMKGLAMDVAYPVMAFDGTLLELMQSNPSGQNLTVFVNSIVGSLFVRCGFFSMYPRVPDFRKCVAIMTYGDDLKGSVSMWYQGFNHISFAEFLSRFGIVFTMPDKKSTATAFMKSEEADFLKRKNVYIPELGAVVGALDEDSIFKSMHCALKSKHVSLLKQQQDALAMASIEWFYHGRKVFEKRQLQLLQVAQAIGLVIPELHDTFDERVASYKEKYGPKSN